MRGTSLFGETLLSHYVCPSCSWRAVGQNGLNGSGFRLSKDSPGRLRPISSSSRNPLLPRRPSSSPKSNFLTTRSIHTQTYKGSHEGTGSMEFSAIGQAHGRPRDNAASFDNDEDSSQQISKERQEYISAILREGQPGKIMASFLDPENYELIMCALPAATFIEALRLLSPEYFIQPYKKIQDRFHQIAALYSNVDSLEQIFSQFSKNLRKIVNARRLAGHSLGLAEYTHLLDCARAMGDGKMATTLWKEMADDGVVPSIECYNHYMGAMVWDAAYVSRENTRIRSTPWIYKHRSSPARKRGFKTGEGGTRDEANRLFHEMAEGGLNADESTFIHLMTAFSREWDIPAVKNTLKAVWNVNVDLLQSYEDSHPPVTRYSTSSPLHPSHDLLFAVAHIFCSNNDLATALQLVDFISTHYNLTIPQHVWSELLIWSFVLSLKRSSQQDIIGQIPRDSVMKIFTTLTSAPYNAAPTLRMYDILTKLKWKSQAIDPTMKYMRDGRDLFMKTLSKRNRVSQNLAQTWRRIISERAATTNEHSNEDSQSRPNDSPTPPFVQNHITLVDIRKNRQVPLSLHKTRQAERINHLSAHNPRFESHPKPQHHNESISPLDFVPSATFPKSYWDLYHKLEILQMAASRELEYIQRWVKFLLLRRRWTGTKFEWERRGLTKVVDEWKPFLPWQLSYHITDGFVEFDPSTFWKGDRPIRRTLERY